MSILPPFNCSPSSVSIFFFSGEINKVGLNLHGRSRNWCVARIRGKRATLQVLKTDMKDAKHA